MEKFISYTSFNLITKHILIKASKKKTILTTPLGTNLKAYEHFNLKKVLNTSMQFTKSRKLFIFCNT